MNRLRWVGVGIHLLLGLLFPYVLGGVIVNAYGFMGPATPKGRLVGLIIAAVYLAVIAAANIWTLKKLSRRDKPAFALLHLLAFAAAAAFMFAIVLR